MRRIVPGGCDKSYGIHVAQLAGLPGSVIHRAQEILTELEGGIERGGVRRAQRARRTRRKLPLEQLLLFGQRPPVLDKLSKLDITSMTTLEAITKLYELQQKAKEV